MQALPKGEKMRFREVECYQYSQRFRSRDQIIITFVSLSHKTYQQTKRKKKIKAVKTDVMGVGGKAHCFD